MDDQRGFTGDVTDSGFFGVPGDDGAEALDASVIALVDELVAGAPAGRDGLLEVLLGVQDAFRRVSWRVQELVADRFGLSPAQVAGVVSFYPLLSDRRRGRRQLGVCTGVGCWQRGSEEILRQAADEAAARQEGVAEPDLDVRRTACIGVCGRGPAVVSERRLQPVAEPATACRLVQRLLDDAEPHGDEP